MENTSIKVATETHGKLKLLSAITGKKQYEIVAALVDAEHQRVTSKPANNGKKARNKVGGL